MCFCVFLCDILSTFPSQKCDNLFYEYACGPSLYRCVRSLRSCGHPLYLLATLCLCRLQCRTQASCKRVRIKPGLTIRLHLFFCCTTLQCTSPGASGTGEPSLSRTTRRFNGEEAAAEIARPAICLRSPSRLPLPPKRETRPEQNMILQASDCSAQVPVRSTWPVVNQIASRMGAGHPQPIILQLLPLCFLAAWGCVVFNFSQAKFVHFNVLPLASALDVPLFQLNIQVRTMLTFVFTAQPFWTL